MADDLSITLQGDKELHEKLDSLKDKLNDDSPDSIIAMAAYAIERRAKINATGRPGPRVQTGRLRSSISTEILSFDSARVGTDVFYAPFVEYGHTQHPGQFVPPLGLRLVNDFCPAYPFLTPAVEQSRDELEGIFVTFSRDIESEFGK